jgi:Predicted RNA-binding protein homologous to eukaryotic snRNP
MLLRKYLLNATIIDVTNQPFERVADYLISCTDDLGYQNEKHLIIELIGKTGNIILTDNNYIILDTIKKMSLDTERERQFFPGTKYSFFHSKIK